MEILQEKIIKTEIDTAGNVFVISERVIKEDDVYKTVKHRQSYEAGSDKAKEVLDSLKG